MKIYYDENMPFAVEFFSDLGELVSFSGRDLTADMVADAEVLLVRSITQVNQNLLAKNSSLGFVGTATIGKNHIDQHYLNSKNIPFYSAPGCNAVSVAEYVLSSLIVLSERYSLKLTQLTVGIVGAGNTGTQLSKKLSALGIRYLLCDPLLEQKQHDQNVQANRQATNQQDKRNYVSLAEALACDVISLHVPLTYEGSHKTFHLLNKERLKKLTGQQILINACRGEVVDNQALLSLKQQGWLTKLVLDVWENEPVILRELIEYCDIATAHIAGHSVEGKARGTEMLYQYLCQHLNKEVKHKLASFLPTATLNKHTLSVYPSATKKTATFSEKSINELVKMVYDVNRDDDLFRQQIYQGHTSAYSFDFIRKNYPARREFSSVNLELKTLENVPEKENIFQAEHDMPYRLGFSYPPHKEREHGTEI